MPLYGIKLPNGNLLQVEQQMEPALAYAEPNGFAVPLVSSNTTKLERVIYAARSDIRMSWIDLPVEVRDLACKGEIVEVEVTIKG